MTDPAGSVSKAQENLRGSLADSTAFRTWVGASGPSAQQQALNRIHHESLPPRTTGEAYGLVELQGMRPFCLLSTIRFHKRKIAAFDFGEEGTLALHFEEDVAVEIVSNEGEIGRRIMNSVGQILDDIVNKSGTPLYLDIDEVELGPYIRSTEEQAEAEGDFVWVDAVVHWKAAT